MIGVELDEAIDGLGGGGRFVILPVAVCNVDLRLLREMAERIATLQRFEIFRALAPVAAGQCVLGL